MQDGIYDEFARRLTEATAAMKVGNGMEDGVEQGPIIDGQGLDKIERHVADARAKGAEVLTGGGRHALGGTYFEPTVLTGMTPDMEMFREETFGPVAGLFRFSTDDEAVAMANDTEFGLAAYIFTNNTSRLFRVGEALEYGMVSANTGIFSSEVGPFGGVKSSGLGREGSKYGIDEFLEIKFGEHYTNGFSTDTGDKTIIAILVHGFIIFIFGKQLAFTQTRQHRIKNNKVLKIKHTLQVFQCHIQQQTDTTWQ